MDGCTGADLIQTMRMTVLMTTRCLESNGGRRVDASNWISLAADVEASIIREAERIWRAGDREQDAATAKTTDSRGSAGYEGENDDYLGWTATRDSTTNDAASNRTPLSQPQMDEALNSPFFDPKRHLSMTLGNATEAELRQHKLQVQEAAADRQVQLEHVLSSQFVSLVESQEQLRRAAAAPP